MFYYFSLLQNRALYGTYDDKLSKKKHEMVIALHMRLSFVNVSPPTHPIYNNIIFYNRKYLLDFILRSQSDDNSQSGSIYHSIVDRRL